MDTEKFYTLLAVPSRAPDSTVAELKSLVADYPWFSLAHQLLLEVSIRNGDENYTAYSVTAAAYASSRQHLYWRLQKPTDESILENSDEIELIEDHFEQAKPIVVKPTEEPAVKQAPIKQQYIVIGGEYFRSEDFDEITVTGNDPLSRFITEKPKFNPITSPLNDMDFEDAKEERVTPMDYVTETLAQIYVSQQLYDLAIGTYKKLILQIPKKNTYFAAQIKEIKKLKQ